MEAIETQIEGYTFSMRLLSVADARKALAALGQAVRVFAMEDEAGFGAATLATVVGLLDEGRLETLMKLFAARTEVRFEEDGEERVLVFADRKLGEAYMDRVFAGRIDLLMQWVSWGVDINFRTLLEKLNAADKAAAKAAPNT